MPEKEDFLGVLLDGSSQFCFRRSGIGVPSFGGGGGGAPEKEFFLGGGGGRDGGGGGGREDAGADDGGFGFSFTSICFALFGAGSCCLVSSVSRFRTVES